MISSHEHPVLISENLCLEERITNKVASYLPQWAGEMEYQDGRISFDARIFGLVATAAVTLLLGFVGWQAIQTFSQNGDIREIKTHVESIDRSIDRMEEFRRREMGDLKNRVNRLEDKH